MVRVHNATRLVHWDPLDRVELSVVEPGSPQSSVIHSASVAIVVSSVLPSVESAASG